MRVIVAGSRSFNDYVSVKANLDEMFDGVEEEITIISGTARGADQLGERYARENGIPLERYPAEWGKYGKRAGYLRNKQMAEKATHLVAFWDGKSRGTKHMINLAQEHGLDWTVIETREGALDEMIAQRKEQDDGNDDNSN